MQNSIKASGPREQLMMRGEAALSDAELLAVLLGTGTATEPVGVVAQKLLVQGGGLRGLARAGIGALSECAGVGPTKACRLRAAIELGLRASAQPLDRHEPIRSSADVAAVLGPRLRDESREHFYALALDVRHRPVAELLIAVGGLTACTIHPADVFRRVLREPAAAVVFVHNHPSGDPTPSPEDASLTTRLRQAGALLGVQVLDHVILGRDSHFSFLDRGLLNPDAPAATDG
jgi:DNA repair protein RadC